MSYHIYKSTNLKSASLGYYKKKHSNIKKTIIKYPKNKLYKVYNFSFLIFLCVFDVKGYLRNHPIQSYCQSYCLVIIVFMFSRCGI